VTKAFVKQRRKEKMKVKHGAIIAIVVLALEASAARPIPRPALAARLALLIIE
jgi:hypothetical protein